MKAMQELEVTDRAIHALHSASVLSQRERGWVVENLWRSRSPEERGDLWIMLSEIQGETPAEESLYEQARRRLLDDPHLTDRYKVLLGALMVDDMFDLKSFHSRQVTEALREVSEGIGNVTSAINGLIQRGDLELADDSPVSKHAHKRYELTPDGRENATRLARRVGDAKEAVTEAR